MTKFVRDVKSGLEKLDSILGEIRTVPVAHDGTTRQVSKPRILETPMKDYSAEFIADLGWYRRTDTEMFRDFLWKTIETVMNAEKKYIFEIIGKTCDASGNNFTAKSSDFWDSYIEMLEDFDVRFDEDGNHNYKLYASENRRKEIESKLPTPEQDVKIKELFERKKKEFYAQKRSRRLS